MISDEYMLKAASRMQQAAETASAAADRMEEAQGRLSALLEDGYGGNGCLLLETLTSRNKEQERLAALAPDLIAGLKRSLEYLEHPDVKDLPFAVPSGVLANQIRRLLAKIKEDA